MANVTVGGSSARVLQFVKRHGASSARLPHVTLLSASAAANEAGIELSGVTGPAGQEMRVPIQVELDAANRDVTANGVSCGTAPAGEASLAVRLGGAPALRAMPIGPALPPMNFTGGWYNVSFSVPASVVDQLQRRTERYPIPWTHSAEGCGLPHCVDDSKATWLLPSRLLMEPFLTEPKEDMDIILLIDDTEVLVSKSYNSRGVGGARCFLGFYYDATGITPDVDHALALKLPDGLPEGTFQGLFWENVETEYSEEVVSCRVIEAQAPSFLV